MSIVFLPFGEFMASCYIPEKNNNSNTKCMRIVLCCFVWSRNKHASFSTYNPQNFIWTKKFPNPQSISSLLCMHGCINAFRWMCLFIVTRLTQDEYYIFLSIPQCNIFWSDINNFLLPFQQDINVIKSNAIFIETIYLRS